MARSALRVIVRRELKEHMASLRLGSVLLMTIALMVLSAAVFSIDYNLLAGRRSPKAENLLDSEGKLHLHNIQTRNDIAVSRSTSRMGFVAGSNDTFFPNRIVMSIHGVERIVRHSELSSSLGTMNRLDWAYIISVLLSFAAGLLTYRSVSGELENNTLGLVLSNSISRATLLAGKYCAAIIVLAVSIVVSVTVALILFEAIGTVRLTVSDFERFAHVVIAMLLFLSCFVLIGLLGSVVSRNSVISAMSFLFVWALMVFVVPNLGGVLAVRWTSVPSPREINEERMSMVEEAKLNIRDLEDESRARIDLAKKQERLLIRYVIELIGQVRFAQALTHVSPVSVHTDVLQELTGVGLERLEQFVENGRRFRIALFDAVLAADAADQDSRHLYIPWQTGTGDAFSRRVVDVGPAAHFIDSRRSHDQLVDDAYEGIGMLALWNVVLFLLCFLSFARQEVTPGSVRL